MLDDFLQTKLYVPQPRPNLVPRPRLLEKLSRGVHGKLTLVSAPAGFGKTTSVIAWIQTITQPVAWLSLDAEDRDLGRFLTYVIAALQTVDPKIGASLLSTLQSPPLPLKPLLTTLLNDVTRHANAFIFVLDDYHVLDAPDIDEALGFLLEHLPPQMHMVITTREDPPLPLARLRVRGQMVELRAADLQFTEAEVAEFLNEGMGLNLPQAQIAALGERTEGWVAGLQLAALSLQGNQATADFVESFSGGHHFVMDYLVDEVLHQQPEEIQAFLLQTSFLARLNGSLCASVLGQTAEHCQRILEGLEQANLFLVPLDGERRWYRYHHLFADLLQRRLPQAATAEQVKQLQGKASIWFEQQGFELEAFRHAAAAGDVARAEALVAGRKGSPLYYRGTVDPILEWVSALPPEEMDARPSLWVLYASVLTIAGQNNPVESILQTAESRLQTTETDENYRDLIGRIAGLRAQLAGPTYDSEEILVQAQLALAHLHPDNLPVRTAVLRAMAVAYQYQGNRSAARDAYVEAIRLCEATGNDFINILSSTGLGIVLESDNQLHQAAVHYRRVLVLCGEPPLPAACEAYLGLARLAYEWNDLDTAERHGRLARQLAEHYDTIDTTAGCDLILARVAIARGDYKEANHLLSNAELFLRQRNFAVRLRQVAPVQIRLLLVQGALGAAARLTEQLDLPLSQARVLLAQGEPEAALEIAITVQQQAAEKQWQDLLLQAQIVSILASAAAGYDDRALQLLDEICQQSELEGYKRTFIDEGEPMRNLLAKLAQRDGWSRYPATLLAAFGTPLALAEPLSQITAVQPLIEPLTTRELEVLQLLADGLSNREIGQRLFLSLSTIKGHNSNIFGKLNVKRRTEAIVRARELGLL